MAGFTIDEARAGYALAERDVRRAEEAVGRAQGRRERREAATALEQARSVLAVSRTMLEKIAKDLGEPPDAPTPSPTPGPARPAEPSSGPPLITSMTREDALVTLRNFGQARTRQGDEFFESEYLEGAFLYATGPARIGINAWGEGDDWALSVFSAARVRVRPSLELYRFVSRWRTTAGAGAPYVVESDGEAAIMCERLFQGSQLANDVTGWRMIASTIDLVGEAATAIARYLEHSPDGTPFTARGPGALMALMSWWEVSDPRITAAVNGG